MRKTKSAALLFAILIGTVTAAAQYRRAPPATLSLDSAYIPSLASNRSMRSAWVEFNHLTESGFNWIDDDTFIGRNFLTRTLLLYVGSYYLNIFLHYPFHVANHELGHGTRVQAMGYQANYYWNGGSRHTSIFSFILDGYSQFGNGAFTRSTGSGKYGPDNYGVAVSAGGMNNSTGFAEALEDEIYLGRGHVNQTINYIGAKLDAYSYAGADEGRFATSGDIVAVMNAWSARGIGISRSDIQTGAATSILASGTTYAYLYSLGKYIVNGEQIVDPIEIGRFKLPDISFFLNRDGLSYRLRSALNGRGYQIPISIEQIYKGLSTTEVSVGYRWISNSFSMSNQTALIQAFVSSAGGVGARVSKDFPSTSDSFFSAGASAFSVNTLEGEREITRLTSATLGGDLWVKWSLVY